MVNNADIAVVVNNADIAVAVNITDTAVVVDITDTAVVVNITDTAVIADTGHRGQPCRRPRRLTIGCHSARRHVEAEVSPRSPARGSRHGD
jgi:hypothetical protein